MSNHSCMLSCHSYNWENGFWRSWSEWWEEWPLAQSRKCFAHSRRVSAGYRFSHASSSNLAEDASMRAEWRRWHTRSCTLCGREIGLTHNTLPGALLASLISDRIPQGKWSGWTVREANGSPLALFTAGFNISRNDSLGAGRTELELEEKAKTAPYWCWTWHPSYCVYYIFSTHERWCILEWKIYRACWIKVSEG